VEGMSRVISKRETETFVGTVALSLPASLPFSTSAVAGAVDLCLHLSCSLCICAGRGPDLLVGDRVVGGDVCEGGGA